MLNFDNRWRYFPNAPVVYGNQGNQQSRVIDDATDEIAIPIAGFPVAGNLQSILVGVTVVTTGGNIDFRCETIGTDGNPSGTLFHANATGSQNITTTGLKTIDFNSGTGFPVAISDQLFVRWKRSGTTNLTFLTHHSATGTWAWPVAYDFNITAATTWTRNGGVPYMAVKISGAWYTAPFSTTPMSANPTNESFQSPAERGVLLMSESPMRVIGAWSNINTLGAASTLKYRLYKTPTTAPVLMAETPTHDSDAFRNTSQMLGLPMYAAGSTTTRHVMEPGVLYALVLAPLGAVNHSLTYAQSTGLPDELFPTGTGGYWVSRADSSTGTFTTNTARWSAMGLIVDGIDIPSESEVATAVWARTPRTLTS